MNQPPNNSKHRNKIPSHATLSPSPGLLLSSQPLDASMANSCHIPVKSKQVICWGDNTFNQLDIKTPKRKYKAYALLVAVGHTHICAIQQENNTRDQTINLDTLCWGSNEFGQIDLDSGIIKHLGLGRGHTCALQVQSVDGVENQILYEEKKSYKIKCFGALRDQYDNYKTAHLEDEFADDINTFMSGSSHICIEYANDLGKVICVGSSKDGESDVPVQLQSRFLEIKLDKINLDEQNPDSNSPVGRKSIIDYNTVLNINDQKLQTFALGDRHSCGIIVDGQVICWGNNSYSQTEPQPVHGFMRPFFIDIQVGAQHNIATNAVGMYSFWGNNQYAQAKEINNRNQRYFYISAGGYHNCLMTEIDGVVCWGNNKFNQCSVPRNEQNNLK